MSDPNTTGWSGLTARPVIPSDPDRTQVEKAFARSFATPDGQQVLAHLRALTLDRALGPEASDAALRSLDGQRCLILHIEALIERGRAPL